MDIRFPTVEARLGPNEVCVVNYTYPNLDGAISEMLANPGNVLADSLR